MPHVNNFSAGVLEDAAHNIYGSIMTIKEGCGCHYPDVIGGFIYFSFNAHVASFGRIFRRTIDEGRIVKVARDACRSIVLQFQIGRIP
jgi:hypothetical protein